MIELKAYSIDELLKTKTFDFNQSNLARLLNINRTTLRKYIKDVDCENHMITVINGKYRFSSIRGLNNATQ